MHRKTAGSASAADIAKASYGNFDIGVGAGVIVPDDTSVKTSGTTSGISYNGSGKFSFTAGPAVTLTAGYNYNDYIRAEAELAYSSFDYDSLSGSINARANGTTYTVSGSTSVSGSVTTYSGMANLILTPWGKTGIVSPYVGGGLGFTSFDDKISRVGTLSVNGSESNTDFSAQAIIGLKATVTDKIDLGARYRFVWANTGKSGIDDFTANVFTANVAYKF